MTTRHPRRQIYLVHRLNRVFQVIKFPASNALLSTVSNFLLFRQFQLTFVFVSLTWCPEFHHCCYLPNTAALPLKILLIASGHYRSCNNARLLSLKTAHTISVGHIISDTWRRWKVRTSTQVRFINREMGSVGVSDDDRRWKTPRQGKVNIVRASTDV